MVPLSYGSPTIWCPYHMAPLPYGSRPTRYSHHIWSFRLKAAPPYAAPTIWSAHHMVPLPYGFSASIPRKAPCLRQHHMVLLPHGAAPLRLSLLNPDTPEPPQQTSYGSLPYGFCSPRKPPVCQTQVNVPLDAHPPTTRPYGTTTIWFLPQKPS